jgi:5-methylcytosine-specific restriction endonuclease McrA
MFSFKKRMFSHDGESPYIYASVVLGSALVAMPLAGTNVLLMIYLGIRMNKVHIDYYTATNDFTPFNGAKYYWAKFKYFKKGNIILIRDSKNGLDTLIRLIEDPHFMSESEKAEAGEYAKQKYVCRYDIVSRDESPSQYKKRITSALRKNIIDRDNHTCMLCHKVYEPFILDVDHKKEYSQSGLSVDNNLVTLCKGCHKIKTNEFKRDSVNILTKIKDSPNVLKN